MYATYVIKESPASSKCSDFAIRRVPDFEPQIPKGFYALPSQSVTRNKKSHIRQLKMSEVFGRLACCGLR